MNPLNLLINIVVAILFVVIIFWLIGMFAASIPLMAVMLLKMLAVLVAIGWVLGFFGSTITLR